MSVDSNLLKYLTTRLLAHVQPTHGQSDELSKVIKRLLSHEDWSQKFSERYIRLRLVEEVLKDLPEDDLSSIISDRLKMYISALDDYSPESTVYLPVEGLKLSRRLKLGHVEFIPVTKAFKSRLLRYVKERISQTKEYKKALVKNYVKAIERAVSTECCAVVTVNAEKGLATGETAITEAEKAIEVLRFTIPRLAGRTENEFAYKTYVGLQGSYARSNRNHFAVDNEGMSYGWEQVGPSYSLQIKGTECKREMERLGVFELSDIIVKPQPTPLESKVIDALHWFASGIIQTTSQHQYLSYAFSVETLVGSLSFGGSIKNSIAETTAFLLGDTAEIRRHIKKRMSELFKIRDNLVHGNSLKPISMDDLRYLEGRAMNLITVLAKNRMGWTSKDDVFKWAEKRKLR